MNSRVAAILRRHDLTVMIPEYNLVSYDSVVIKDIYMESMVVKWSIESYQRGSCLCLWNEISDNHRKEIPNQHVDILRFNAIPSAFSILLSYVFILR